MFDNFFDFSKHIKNICATFITRINSNYKAKFIPQSAVNAHNMQ